MINLRGKRSEMVNIKFEDGWCHMIFPPKEEIKMNWIEEVAGLIGITKGERFRLEKSSPEYVFYFDDEGLHCEKPYPSPMGEVFQELVCGKRKVKKFRRRPDYNEKYWFVNGNDSNHRYISYAIWEGSAYDHALYVCGNCFESEYEAKLAIPWYNENIESFVRGLEWRVRE